jgi:hypothetical protein
VAVHKTVMLRDDGEPLIVDAIEYDGKWWIVPQWLQGPIEGTLRPVRIICLDNLELDRSGLGRRTDWTLETPLSRDVLEGRAISQVPLVIERPNIILRDSDFHR